MTAVSECGLFIASVASFVCLVVTLCLCFSFAMRCEGNLLLSAVVSIFSLSAFFLSDVSGSDILLIRCHYAAVCVRWGGWGVDSGIGCLGFPVYTCRLLFLMGFCLLTGRGS
jgi:hypothetical protein